MLFSMIQLQVMKSIDYLEGYELISKISQMSLSGVTVINALSHPNLVSNAFF